MDAARKALEALEEAGKAATDRPWGHGDGCCGPFLDFQEASPEWDVNWNGRSALWLGGTVDEKDRAFIVAAVNLSAPLAAVVRAAMDWREVYKTPCKERAKAHRRYSANLADERAKVFAALDAFNAAAAAQGFGHQNPPHADGDAAGSSQGREPGDAAPSERVASAPAPSAEPAR